MATSSAPPSRVTAGDTWTWLWTPADYPATDGWTMSWRVIGAGVALTVPSVASGTGFRATADAAATAALVIGARGLAATLIGWAARGGERFESYRGEIMIDPDPATITGDIRGPAALALEAVNAMIRGKATKDQMSYKIGDRELSRIPIPDLIVLQTKLEADAKREKDAASLQSGRPRQTMVRTQMSRR